MNDTLELLGDGTVSSGHGGRRPGAGRPKGYSPKQAAALDEGITDGVSDTTAVAHRKAKAVADKEEALAKQAWLKFRIDSKEYLPRTAFREASATLLAEMAQALRSLPDLLERKVNLSPEALILVEQIIDEQLNNIANELELFTGAEE